MSNYNASIQNILQQLNTFPITTSTNDDWNMYSVNELTFYESNITTIPNDNLSNIVEQRQMIIGSLIFTELDDPTTYTVQNISSPVGFYVDLVYGCGHYDINGVFSPKGSFDTDVSNIIHINIQSVSVYLTRGGQVTTFSSTPDISYSFLPVSIDCNQFAAINHGQYYGIQFIGMLQISNLKIPVIPSATYDIGVTITYTYDHTYISQFDAFQTGLFVNLTSDNVDVTVPPFQFLSSPNTNYAPGQFASVS